MVYVATTIRGRTKVVEVLSNLHGPQAKKEMTPADNRAFEVQQMDIINAEYEEEKAAARAAGRGHSITRAIIAKRHRLHPKRLAYFRTNHYTPSRIARKNQ